MGGGVVEKPDDDKTRAIIRPSFAHKDEKSVTNPSEVTNVSQIFTCEDCGKEYKQFGRFKRHVQEKHTKVVMEALVKCNECPSYFENKKKLNCHKKTHM